MPPPLIPYIKGPLTYIQQLQRLKDRGMIVKNEARALHLLEKISYYRLSGYWYPFIANRTTNKFTVSTTFETAFNLYCFDRELRLLILNELEKIEVAVRAHLIYEYAHAHGAFWYNNASLFRNRTQHGKMLSSINPQYSRSDEEFIQAFQRKYNNPLPPSWMLMEIISFGTLSKLYQNLKPGRIKRNVAKRFGINENTFQSWLHSIVYLRNVCAHHSRMWNRVFQITPAVPRRTANLWLKTVPPNNRSYFMLSVVVYMLQEVNPKSTFKSKFKKLLKKDPETDTLSMGFLPNWEEEPLWQSPKRNWFRKLFRS